MINMFSFDSLGGLKAKTWCNYTEKQNKTKKLKKFGTIGYFMIASFKNKQ